MHAPIFSSQFDRIAFHLNADSLSGRTYQHNVVLGNGKRIYDATPNLNQGAYKWFENTIHIQVAHQFLEMEDEMIEIREHGPDISIKDIEQFEQHNGLVLPDQYKQFLLKNNGGRPVPDNVIIPGWAGEEAAVHFFKKMNEAGTNLQWWRTECIDELRNDYLVIATCPYGNTFVIGINSENFGKVFFWDSSWDFVEENDGKTIYFLADSFNEFLNLLHEYKE